jgi:DNA adenine methylase
MTDTQHWELAEVLNSVQGMVAFSNYQAPILEKLYPDTKWHKTVSPERTNHSTKDKRVEVLWTNYDPHKIKHNGRHTHGELFQIA